MISILYDPYEQCAMCSPSSTTCIFVITNHYRSFRYASPYLWDQLPSSFHQPHCVHSPPGSPHLTHTRTSWSCITFSLSSLSHLSIPQPFTPDIKLTCSTNLFLHSLLTTVSRGTGVLDSDRLTALRLFCFSFYRAMHFSAKRGIAIACRLSVRPSVCL